MLDRLMAAGPYTALVSATVPLGIQLAANHGLIQGGTLGTVPPAELIGAMAPPSPEQAAAWEAMARQGTEGAAGAEANGFPAGSEMAGSASAP
jgi:hypothetical protein